MDLQTERSFIASRVVEEAAPDVGKLGLEIISFSVRGIRDDNGFLEALGVTQSSNVKAAAAIAAAEANRDACIKEESAMKECHEVCHKNETDIDNYRKEFLSNLAKLSSTIFVPKRISYEKSSCTINGFRTKTELYKNLFCKKNIFVRNPF